jgi:hypothetical protein
MRDALGNTVEQVTYSCPARTVFVVRAANGVLLHGSFGAPEPTTPAQVAALGVDLATLEAA